MLNRYNDFGWEYPVNCEISTGRIKTSSYKENIAESVKIILKTKKGERVMRTDFGCDISKYMFEVADFSTLREIEREVESALEKWEPRIENIDVNVKQSEDEAGKLVIYISYNILNSREVLKQQYLYNINE